MRPDLTRFTAELVDRDQEQRFRAYQVRTQRRTALVTLLAIIIANLLTFGFSLISADRSFSPAHVIAQFVGTAIAIALAVGLGAERRHTWMMWLISAAVVTMTALVAVVMATGTGMGFRGAILLIGGVAVIYLTVPLHLRAVTGFALAYSAVTMPIWFLAIERENDIDVAYTVMAVVLAHVLSYNEARRAQRERRVLFAQREVLLAMSSIDPLTGLMNRRAVDDELARALAAATATATPLSVLMVDIDHFKRLNDTQGHIAGDHALRLVADVIRVCMPMVPGQIAARYGGEEFICLLPGLGTAEAAVVAGQILAGVRRVGIPLTAAAGDHAILTVSAGVAAIGPDRVTPATLVGAADRQLYRAKEQGRNCVRVEASGLAMRRA